MSRTDTSVALRRATYERWPLPLRLAPVALGALLAVTVALTVTADPAPLSAPTPAAPGAPLPGPRRRPVPEVRHAGGDAGRHRSNEHPH